MANNMKKLLTFFLVLLSVQAFAQRKVQWRDLGATVKDRINSKGVFLSTWGSLSAAVDAATAGYLIIDDSVLTTVNKDLSSITVLFTEAGMLNVQTGDTITFSDGNILAAKDQKIFHDGGGEVRMPGAHVYAKWFGAAGDGTTEDASTVQWGLDALRAGSDAYTQLGTYGVFEFNPGTYELNPEHRIFCIPDSGRTLWIKGSGLQSRIHNTDFADYGDLIADHGIYGDALPGGTLRVSDLWFTGTHRGDADGTGGVNTITGSISNIIIERVRIDSSGNRAIAFEGYSSPLPGWKDVVIRDVEINYSWKNAISFNKHDDTEVNSITMDNVNIDGFSEITNDSSTSQVAAGVQVLYNATSTNPGHSFYMNNCKIINGYSNALVFNGALYKNDVRVENTTIRDNDLQYSSGGAALLNTSIVYGFFNAVKIINNSGGPGVRDRTTSPKVFTNSVIDSNGTYGFDLTNKEFQIVNSRIADNGTGQFYFSGGTVLPYVHISNSFIRGDTLLVDTGKLLNPKSAYIVGSGNIWEEIDLSPADGYNIVQNGYWARDSVDIVRDDDNNGIPDGWAIDISESIKDSFYVALNDSGLVLWNRATTSGDVVLRQYINGRAQADSTYDFEVYVYAQNAINCRLYNNATDLGSINPAGDYSYTGQTVSGYVQFGRQGASEWNANTRVVLKWIRVLKE